jgi:hypothetical protein
VTQLIDEYPCMVATNFGQAMQHITQGEGREPWCITKVRKKRSCLHCCLVLWFWKETLVLVLTLFEKVDGTFGFGFELNFLDFKNLWFWSFSQIIYNRSCLKLSVIPASSYIIKQFFFSVALVCFQLMHTIQNKAYIILKVGLH